MIVMGGIVGAGIFANPSEVAHRDLSRGLLLGVDAVVGLYLAVNLVCLRVLGPAGLDATTTPASDVMRIALANTERNGSPSGSQSRHSDFSAKAC